MRPDSGETLGGRLVMLLRLAVFIGLAALIPAGAGCGDAHERASGAASLSPSDERPRPGGEFHVWEAPGLRGWDPHESADITSAVPLSQVFEGLVQYSPQDPNEVVGAIAASWEISEGGRRYLFHLREGARFANDPCFPGGAGRRIVARDVAYSLERAFRKGARTILPSSFKEIEGAREFLAGEAPSIRGISVVDDRTLGIRLRRPRPALLHGLALNPGHVVPPEADEYYGEDVRIHPVGSGPFRCARWDPDRSITLVRNENYWERDRWGTPVPYLDRLVIVTTPSQEPGQEGGLHARRAIPQEGAGTATAASSRGLQYFQSTRYSTIYLGWRMDRDNVWTRSPLLREAVSLSLRRNEGVMDTAARGLLPPGIPGYESTASGQRYDLDRARALLSRAGHRQGAGLPRLTVSLFEGDVLQGVVEGSLGDLGIPFVVVVRSRAEHWAAVDAGNLDFFRGGWLADYPDPESFFETFYGPSSLNQTRFKDARYDSLYERLVEEGDPARRLALVAELHRILMKETPACFLRHDIDAMVVWPEVRGFAASMNPLWRKFYKYVWFAA